MNRSLCSLKFFDIFFVNHRNIHIFDKMLFARNILFKNTRSFTLQRRYRNCLARCIPSTVHRSKLIDSILKDLRGAQRREKGRMKKRKRIERIAQLSIRGSTIF